MLFVIDLVANILSLGRLDGEGYLMTMARGKLTIFYCDGCLFAKAQRSKGQLYLLQLSVVDQCLVTTEDNSKDWLWHSGFGHISFDMLKEMLSKKLFEGLPQVNVPIQLCRNCVVGKHHRTPYPQATEPLELIYANICGPISPPTLGGSRYFLLVIDNFLRLTWVSMLQQKSNAFESFK